MSAASHRATQEDDHAEDLGPQRAEPELARHARAGGIRQRDPRRCRGGVPAGRQGARRRRRLPPEQPRRRADRLAARGRPRPRGRDARRRPQRRRLHAYLRRPRRRDQGDRRSGDRSAPLQRARARAVPPPLVPVAGVRRHRRRLRRRRLRAGDRRPGAHGEDARPTPGDDREAGRVAGRRGRRRRRRRDGDDRRLRHRRPAQRARRRAARAGREGPDDRQQQRRQRRHRPGGADRGAPRAQDRLLVPAPGRQPPLRPPLPRRRDRARAGAAGQPGRADPRRRRRHRRLLHADRLRHRPRQGQGDARDRRPHVRARSADPRRLRASSRPSAATAGATSPTA